MSELNTISAHVPENACPGLDPEWIPVFRKGHAPTQELRAHLDSIETGCALVKLPRPAILQELRRLIPAAGIWHKPLPFDLPAIDSHLPDGGLACGALHEVVPETDAALPAALGFIAALLARISSSATQCQLIPPPTRGARKRSPGEGREQINQLSFIFVLPTYSQRRHGRLSGHGLNSLGLNPAHLILVETAHRKDTLWAFAEALRSAAPFAVAGMIDRLELKLSQKLQLAAGDAGRPLFLIRPAVTLEASAAATRWRVGTAPAARDRFGLYAHPCWHLQLERARNGRPGEWAVEYDHVAHRFSLAAALVDSALCCRAGDRAGRPAGRP